MEAPIFISPHAIVFPPTYISDVSRYAFKIVNRSASTFHYEWRKYPTSADEKALLSAFDKGDPTQRQRISTSLLFSSKIFTFESTSTRNSQVFPNSFDQVVVRFTPELSQTYTETCYLYIIESGERIALKLSGTALSPEAHFSADIISVGHVQLNSILDYEVALSNTGHVDVDFCLEERILPHLRFDFSPEEGHISIGQSVKIRIRFTADYVGNFSECFQFKVRGMTAPPPSLTFYGKVLGPTVAISTDSLCFGEVSFGFLYEKVFDLENKSDIPFDFHILLPTDGSFARREFSITPSAGTVQSFSHLPIKVEFIPMNIGPYSVKLSIDVDECSESGLSLPITATCVSPKVSLQSDTIDFGSIFINHPYSQVISFVNDTDLPAKYEFMEASPQQLAKLNLQNQNGILPPHETSKVSIEMTALQLGRISLQNSIKILGSSSEPMNFSVKAVSTGPNIALSQTSLTFKSVQVLKESQQTIVLTNSALIPAPFKIEVEKEPAVFLLDKSSGLIPPGESEAISIIAIPDDNMQFQGQLVISFDNLSPFVIPLSVTGVGSSIVSSIDMQCIDLNYILTQREETRDFTLTNYGRRTQEVRFMQPKPKISNESAELEISIEPESVILKPKESAGFKAAFKCDLATSFTANIISFSIVSKARHDLFQTLVKGNFIDPALKFSTNLVEFKYIHDVNKEEAIGSGSTPSATLLMPVFSPLTVTNTSKLSLSILADCPQPFSLQSGKFMLKPSESLQLELCFNPSFKKDFSSETVNKKLYFMFEGHSHKAFVSLKGSLSFPNLTFSVPGAISFGNLLLNTEQTKDVEMHCVGELPVDYRWQLLPSATNASQAFDIYPLRGTLEASQKEVTHFHFYAVPEKDGKSAHFFGTAVCHVKGGPDYQIELSGSSAKIQCKIDPSNLHFDDCYYEETLKSEVTLTNLSDVAALYYVRIPKSSSFSRFEVFPTDGSVPIGGSVKFAVTIVPGLPKNYAESFFIRIGHFDEIRVDIDVNCFLPHLDYNSEVTDRNEEAQQFIESKAQKKELFIAKKIAIDLGKIVFGRIESKEFSLTALAPFATSFDISQDSLSGSGFSIDPYSVHSLPGGTSLPIKVIFDTKKRTKTELGRVEYETFIQFNSEFCYSLTISAFLEMPSLGFSQLHFDFGTTIVGQSYVMTLQLQNMNSISVEYKFADAQSMSVLQRSSTPSVFTCNPSSGVLAPASFRNVDITFAPTSEKSYSMQFPVEIKHNSQPFFITLKGVGAQLKVTFEPPELNLPPVLPFSEPSSIDVAMHNPTSYIIEVLAQQFDSKLLTEPAPKLEEIIGDVTFEKETATAKFSLCIIVHGPVGSGKSTVSHAISAELGIPVISLKELWGSLSGTQSDYVAKFSDEISKPRYSDGFVIDGLDGVPEPNEQSTFMSHCIKQRGLMDELKDHPLTAVPHQHLSSFEQALAYILAALDGHYAFLVCLKAAEETLLERDEIAKAAERSKRHSEMRKERESLFMMTEEQYDELSDEKKAEADSKRQGYRKKLLKDGEDKEEVKHHHNSKGGGHTSARKKVKTESKPKSKSIPVDPIPLSVLSFQITLGSLSQRMAEGGKNFTAIDPKTLCKIPENDGVESIVSSNVIVVESKGQIDQINKHILGFLPRLNQLKEKAFTCFTKPPRYVLPSANQISPIPKMPLYFSIVNDEPQMIRPDSHSTKTGRKSRHGNEREDENPKLTPRWTLEPNSSKVLKIKFDAQLVGNYTDTILFSIANGKSDVFRLKVNGSVSYPDLDRAITTIFPKISQRLTPKTEFSYVNELNEFHFGSLLVLKEKTKAAQFTYRQAIKLSNTSLFPAEVTAVLNSQKPVFFIESPQVTIQPGETSEFYFAAHPTIPGVYKSLLSLFIKNHPDPIFCTLACEGCTPSIEPSTQSLDFEKLLLNQKKALTLTLKNTGKLSAFWRLKTATIPHFTFSTTEGLIPPKSSSEIAVEYESSKQVSLKKSLALEVLDAEQSRLFSTTPIQIAAESFDVFFDFQFPKGIDHLQFGSLKVDQQSTLSCTLKNRGKYPSLFTFVTHRSAQYVKIVPMEGCIPSDKQVQVNFTFAAPKTVKYDHANGITLKIADSITKTETAAIPISYSAVTLYSSFSIEPSLEIDFGSLPVQTQVSKPIIIINNGIFPFEFEFHPQSEPQSSQKIKKKPSQKSRSKSVSFGPFSITPSSSIVQPGSQVEAAAEFFSASEGSFSSSVSIQITDTNPSEPPVLLPLKASTYVPSIITSDFERIFSGQHLCLRYDISRTEQTAFLEDEQIFHFSPLILQQRRSVKVSLINPLPISCTADVNIKQKSKVGSNPFEVSEKSFEIPPSSSKNFEISFIPITCDTFFAMIEASVRGGKGSLKFGVEGVGTLPSLNVISNLEKSKNGIFNISFGRVLIGFNKEKSISISNDGLIPAKISIVAKPSADFELVNYESIQECTIEPQRHIDLTVVYRAQKPRRDQFEVSVSVTDNPKSNLSFVYSGEGFGEDLIIEGLPNEDNDLVFKDNIVGRLQTSTFVMKNVSQSDIRFSWGAHPDFTFNPQVGHIRKGSQKVIAVSLFTEKCAKYNGLKILCQWTKIQREEGAPDWDDSQKVVSFVSKDDRKLKRTNSSARESVVKMIEVKAEPQYTVVPGKFKDIQLRIFSVSDFIKFQIDSSEVLFAPTMMYQERVSEVRMSNTSQIRLEYSWSVEEFKALRTDVKMPFRIEPNQGFIDVGQTTVFKVRFLPEEVDDFSATFRCTIPFLSQCDPPLVRVNGISRRPLCHFSVELSDYLSAGRRHPDYTDPLPADVKVVELFSKAIGIPTTKKFEIVNPTSGSYEVSWELISPKSGSPITCDTPNAIISSGKRYSVSFTFLPVSVKTVEALWLFQISEHNIRVNFLTVGRIVPH